MAEVSGQAPLSPGRREGSPEKARPSTDPHAGSAAPTRPAGRAEPRVNTDKRARIKRRRPAGLPPPHGLPSMVGLEAQTPREGPPSLLRGWLPPHSWGAGAGDAAQRSAGRSWSWGSPRGIHRRTCAPDSDEPLDLPCELGGQCSAGHRARGLLRNPRPGVASKESWQLTAGQEGGVVGCWSQTRPSPQAGHGGGSPVELCKPPPPWGSGLTHQRCRG